MQCNSMSSRKMHSVCTKNKIFYDQKEIINKTITSVGT